jgi:DNA-binding MarR family transcriptional regulator
MLSEAPERTLRMTALPQQTNVTFARLSHVMRRLEDRGLIERFPCSDDAPATKRPADRRGLVGSEGSCSRARGERA